MQTGRGVCLIGILALAGCGSSSTSESSASGATGGGKKAALIGAATISVTPTTDLIDGQSVTISGAGFSPGDFVSFGQRCPTLDDCPAFLGNTMVFDHTLTIGDDGTFQESIPVSLVLPGHDVFNTYSCATPGACSIGADYLRLPEPEVWSTNSVPLSFRPVPPPVLGTGSIVSIARLPGQLLAVVQGAGWAPARELEMFQCVAAEPTYCNVYSNVRTDAGGSFESTVSLLPSMLVGATDPPTDVNCAEDAGACILVLADVLDPTGTRLAIPLNVPSGPGPTLSIAPSGTLGDGQVVTVTGSHYPSGSAVSVCQATSLEPNTCIPGAPAASAVTGADGTFQAQLQARRAPGNGVSCGADAPCQMRVVISVLGTQTTQAVPLVFSTPAPGTVTTAPTPVIVGGTLSISGQSWTGVGSVDVMYCPVPYYQPAFCQSKTTVPVTPQGTFSTSLIATSSMLDCTKPPGCIVRVEDSGDANIFRESPVSARLAEAGTVQLSSSTVTGGDSIVVTGSGWSQAGGLFVSYCPKVSAVDDWCRVLAVPAAVTAQGTFSATVRADEYVRSNRSNPADCTMTPGACVVRVEYDKSQWANTIMFPYQPVFAEAPVTVSAAPTSAVVSLDARGPLVYGMHARVLGSGWAARHGLELALCHAGICWPRGTAETDASGSLRAYVPLRVGGDGAECSTANACWLTILDTDLQGDRATLHTPLTFASGESFEITSHYEPAYEGLFQQGLGLSGLSASEFQKQGAAVLLWVLATSGASSGAHLSHTGSTSHATSYTADEYRLWSEHAARFDYTIDEAQKMGAAFWAWLLAGRPPLPE